MQNSTYFKCYCPSKTIGLWIFSFIFFMSCSEQEDVLEPDDTVIEDVRLVGDMLVFKSPEIFESTLKEMQSVSHQEMLDWSSSFSFHSLLHSLEKAKEKQESISSEIDEMIRHFESLDDYQKEDFIKSNEAVIQQTKNDYLSFQDHNTYLRLENDLVVGLNILDFYASPLLNANAMVRVGDFLYQYTDKALKITPYIDESSIKKLNESHFPDEKSEIYFSNSEQINAGGNLRTASSSDLINEDVCSFEFDSNRDGDKYAVSHLLSKTVRHPKYKTVQRTRCTCVEWSEPGDGFDPIDSSSEIVDGEGIYCLREECTTVDVTTFSHWEVSEIHVLSEISSFKESCTNFVFFDICKTSPKKVQRLEMEVLSGGFRFGSSAVKVAHDASFLSHLGVYDASRFGPPYLSPTPGQEIRVNFTVNEGINGGFANCVNQVTP